MALSNWIELAALVLIVSAGLVLWRVLKRKLRRHDGFEGIESGKGKPQPRRHMDVDDEIAYLERLLGGGDDE